MGNTESVRFLASCEPPCFRYRGKSEAKDRRALWESTINGTPVNGAEENAKVVTPHQWFGWISSLEKHFKCSGLNCAQATGGLLYQRACVMLK